MQPIKRNKKTRTVTVSDEGYVLWAELSRRLGISQTAVLELAIREKAKREDVVLKEER